MERVAATDPLRPEPAALEQAVLLNRLERELGTRGSEAASGRHPLRRPLIAPDQGDSDLPCSHNSILARRAWISRTMSGSVAPRDEGNPMRTASRCAHGPASRHASRNLRRARFLLAWHPMERAVVNPMSPAPAWAHNLANLPLARLPCRNTSSNLFRFRALGAETLAPFCAPSAEHVLPVGRPHPDAKAVRLASFAVVGLERPFHFGGTFGSGCAQDTSPGSDLGPST